MTFDIDASGFELTNELQEYTAKKVTKLMRRLPRKLRTLASCTVHFVQQEVEGAKQNTCNLIFKLDKFELSAAETTQHIYTALDITTVHIDQQLKEYLTHRWRE